MLKPITVFSIISRGGDTAIDSMVGYPAAFIIGLAMIVKSGYEYLVSEGDPGRTKAASENLVSAVTGVLFVVLSGVILKIIMGIVLGL